MKCRERRKRLKFDETDSEDQNEDWEDDSTESTVIGTTVKDGARKPVISGVTSKVIEKQLLAE